jgi:hypothetical protein
VQVEDAATVFPEQLSLDLANSDAFVPVIASVPIVRFVLPGLETVNVCADDELPTATLP